MSEQKWYAQNPNWYKRPTLDEEIQLYIENSRLESLTSVFLYTVAEIAQSLNAQKIADYLRPEPRKKVTLEDITQNVITRRQYERWLVNDPENEFGRRLRDLSQERPRPAKYITERGESRLY